MRKLWLSLALGLALVAPRVARAQGSIGLSGGPLYSRMSGEAITDQAWRWGFQLGAFGEYRFDRHWAMRVEANFVQKGGNDLMLDTGETLSFVKLNHVEVPLLLNVILPLSPAVELGFYSGATLGFNTKCEFTLVATADPVDCATAPTGDAKSTEWSVPFGADFMWNVPSLKSALILDGRFTLGLTDAFESATAKNQSFTLLFRWAYFLPGT